MYEGSCSWTKHLPQTPHADIITLDIRIFTYEFWADTSIQTKHHPNHSPKMASLLRCHRLAGMAE